MIAGRHPRRAHPPAQYACPVIQCVGAEPDACAAARENRRWLGRNAHPGRPNSRPMSSISRPTVGCRCICLCASAWARVRPVAAKAANCARISAASWRRMRGLGSVVDAEAELARREPTLYVDEIGDLGRRQHGSAFDHHEMQPDTQVGHGARAAYGIGSCGPGHHQTGGVQDAGAVGALDRLVDGLGEAEIVGGEEDVLHIHTGAGAATMAGTSDGNRVLSIVLATAPRPRSLRLAAMSSRSMTLVARTSPTRGNAFSTSTTLAWAMTSSVSARSST